MSLAKRILENQLRIEKAMASAFTSKALIEPKLSRRAQQQMKGNNPFYKLENIDMLSDLQLTKLLNEVGITMPPGVSPNSPEGRVHITNQLRIISDVSGEQIKTVNDLIRITEDPLMKIQNSIDKIKEYQAQIKDNTENTLEYFLNEESKLMDKMDEVVAKGDMKETKKREEAKAVIPTYLTSADLKNMSKKQLIEYGESLGITGIRSKNKPVILERINDYIDNAMLSISSF